MCAQQQMLIKKVVQQLGIAEVMAWQHLASCVTLSHVRESRVKILLAMSALNPKTGNKKRTYRRIRRAKQFVWEIPRNKRVFVAHQNPSSSFFSSSVFRNLLEGGGDQNKGRGLSPECVSPVSSSNALRGLDGEQSWSRQTTHNR